MTRIKLKILPDFGDFTIASVTVSENWITYRPLVTNNGNTMPGGNSHMKNTGALVVTSRTLKGLKSGFGNS